MHWGCVILASSHNLSPLFKWSWKKILLWIFYIMKDLTLLISDVLLLHVCRDSMSAGYISYLTYNVIGCSLGDNPCYLLDEQTTSWAAVYIITAKSILSKNTMIYPQSILIFPQSSMPLNAIVLCTGNCHFNTPPGPWREAYPQITRAFQWHKMQGIPLMLTGLSIFFQITIIQIFT